MLGHLTKTLLRPFDLLLYTNICQICRSYECNSGDGYVCRRCQKKVAPITEPWCPKCGTCRTDTYSTPSCIDCINMQYSKARSLFLSQALPREIIHQLKYNQNEYFEPLIRKWLHKILSSDLNLKPNAVIPVPLHSVKQRERGINQSESIARIISKYIDAPVKPRLLKRIQATESQTHLSRTNRMINIRNTFTCVENVQNGHYLIVDDVMTTGATVNECAKALLNRGAASTEVFTIARGVPTR